jgi:ATPase subunit of ABC transporter with duplicated ATPase domains
LTTCRPGSTSGTRWSATSTTSLGGHPGVREVSRLLGGLDAPWSVITTAVALSGGQRRRVALARFLVAHGVLLDEPTNHLDVEASPGWQGPAHPLARRPGRLIVSPDRWFLDAVCTATWEVHDGVVDSYEGGYAAYVLARAERSRIAVVTEERRQNLVRKELAWLRRGAPARTSKPRFRLDVAAALIADEPPPRDGLALQKMATARLGKDVIDLEDVSLAVGGQGDGSGSGSSPRPRRVLLTA